MVYVKVGVIILILMQEHVFYHIISKSNNKDIRSISNQFHPSIPIRAYKKNQDLSSVAYLSSLMQTQNLIHNKLHPPPTYRNQEENIQQKNSLKQLRGKSQRLQQSSSSKIRLSKQSRRIFKNSNALSNLVGQLNPIKPKKQNKFMEEMIDNARTYAILVKKQGPFSSYKKRQNETKLKQDFHNYIKKQDWKPQIYSKKSQPNTQYINNKQLSSKPSKGSQTADLYHFLKAQSKMKRMKTCGTSVKEYAALSKRMTGLMLKSQLRVEADNFKLMQIGNQKNFKLKTTQ